MTGRENQFKSSQADLDRTINEQLYKDDAERKLSLRRSQLEADRNAQKKTETENLISGIVNTGLTIAGTKIATSGTKSAPSYTPEKI